MLFYLRLQQSTSSADDFEKKRSQAAIRAMAQKELEKERQVKFFVLPLSQVTF